MKIRSGTWCLLLAVMTAVVPAMEAAAQSASQSTQQTPDSEKQHALIRSVEGVDLYRAYCASCHGKDGKGNGPVAAALKATVPDLTLIASSNGGSFPVARMSRIIMGEGMIASHGSREMPVWGPIFHQVEWDVDRGNVRLDNLVKYLQSIQSVPSRQDERGKKTSAEDAPSGEQLYAQNCSPCHGIDLKGVGPAPYPFKEKTPDLTTLSQRHGGIFPAAYVFDVVRNGVVVPDHGPPEMPTWGADFKARDGLNETQVTSRISNLTAYIKSLQTK
jgi:mono/diheme cytochrome c family protein